MITALLFVIAVLLGVIAFVIYALGGFLDECINMMGSAFGFPSPKATFLDYWLAHIFSASSIGVFIWAIIRLFS